MNRKLLALSTVVILASCATANANTGPHVGEPLTITNPAAACSTVFAEGQTVTRLVTNTPCVGTDGADHLYWSAWWDCPDGTRLTFNALAWWTSRDHVAHAYSDGSNGPMDMLDDVCGAA